VSTKVEFESSDDVRNARPLAHGQTLTFTEPLPLEKGERLSDVTVAYETYGQLSPARDNAILICHAISGDSHVAKHNASDDPGWWDLMVGPGKPIDTDKYFVICSNILGGCRGTTGPSSINPETGKRYGKDFPMITLNDMVDVQKRLVDHLGIKQLLAIVGGSLGGHQALTWATRYPDSVKGVVALATSARLTSQALAFDVVGRNAILRDPCYHGGQYYDKPHGPTVGLALARMIGHITYLSPQAMEKRFQDDRMRPRDVAIEFEKRFSVGSYLGYQGARFVERFDANSYVTLSLAMDLFDLGDNAQKLAQTFSRARCRWLVVSFSSDWLFTSAQSREIVNALVANKAQVSYCEVKSDSGHDAFLLENEIATYGGMTQAFLRNMSSTDPSGLARADVNGPTSIFRQHRLDYDRMLELIPEGKTILDLGCGSGGLLARARIRKPRRLVGVELDEKLILTCIDRNLDVIQADLNKGLASFATDEFDFVVLSRTLQAVNDVERLISEILRIGRKCIISIPNFAYAPLRKMLFEEGRAPKSQGVLHYEWHNTPNVRFFTLKDFEEFCALKSIRIHQSIALNTETGSNVSEDPNLNADLAIYVIGRENAPG